MVSRRDIDKFMKDLSYTEVKDLRDAAQQRVDELEGEAKEKAKKELAEKAQQLGFDLSDLFPVVIKAQVRRTADSSPRGAGQRASPKAKYRLPNGVEWSGRGRIKKEFQLAIAEGKKLEDFEIK